MYVGRREKMFTLGSSRAATRVDLPAPVGPETIMLKGVFSLASLVTGSVDKLSSVKGAVNDLTG